MHKVIIGNATLYCGDCREILPALEKVDAVVTDPPYGTEELGLGYGRRQLHTEDGRSSRKILNDKDLSVFSDALKILPVEECFVLAFYSSRRTKQFIDAIGDIEYIGEIIWDKKQMGLGYTIRYSHESIAVLKYGDNPRTLFPIDSCLEFHQSEKIHPHQKPVELMKKLISWQYGSVLDPFMGSGTTGVAAVQMGRKFIGIELDPDYFKIACKRIEDAQRQGDFLLTK